MKLRTEESGPPDVPGQTSQSRHRFASASDDQLLTLLDTFE
jgi:hypothetical protein